MAEEKKLPKLENTATVEVSFKFPTSVVTVKNVTLGRGKVTCMALCKKFDFEQTSRKE